MEGTRSIEEILHDLKLKVLQERGDSKDVVWGKMKGHSAWPAHILPEDVAKRINLKKRGKKNQPVMFFGMREVAYLPIKKVSRWSIGIIQATKQMEKDLAMNRTSESGSRAKLYQAVDEALVYLAKDQSSKAWWDDADDEANEMEEDTDTDGDLGTSEGHQVMRANIASGEDSNDPHQSTGQEGAPSHHRDTSEGVSNNSLGEGSKTGTLEEQYTSRQTLEERLNEFKIADELVWKKKQGRPKTLKEGDVEKCHCRLGVGNCRENCILRAVQIRCDPRVCPSGDLCENKPFDRIDRPSIVPFMTSDKGVGVKADQDIHEGAFIIEYTGEVIDKEELTMRFEKTKNAPGEYMDYYMQLQSGLWIDARNQGNYSRFINSSCEPNCSAERYTDAATNQQRIGIFARSDITSGTELTYDYLMVPIHHERYSEHLRCRCGAPKCRGVTLKHGSRAGSGSKKRKRGQQHSEEIDPDINAMESVEDQVVDDLAQDRLSTPLSRLDPHNNAPRPLQAIAPVCGLQPAGECAKFVVPPTGILCTKPTQAIGVKFEAGKLELGILDVGSGV